MVKWLSMTVIGTADYLCRTTLNICLVSICRGKNSSKISIVLGIFGVGSLIAPQLVTLLQFQFYYFLAGLFFIMSIVFMYNSTLF